VIARLYAQPPRHPSLSPSFPFSCHATQAHSICIDTRVSNTRLCGHGWYTLHSSCVRYTPLHTHRIHSTVDMYGTHSTPHVWYTRKVFKGMCIWSA